jgi:hypothetical protein
VYLGIHQGGAACKTHRLGGAVAENEPCKGDIHPRMASGLGKKSKQSLNEQLRRVDGGRSMWVQRVFLSLGYVRDGCLAKSRCWQWLSETSDGIHYRSFDRVMSESLPALLYRGREVAECFAKRYGGV